MNKLAAEYKDSIVDEVLSNAIKALSPKGPVKKAADSNAATTSVSIIALTWVY
jgi:hypothetical protein